MGYPPFREARPTRTQPTQSHYSRQEHRKGAVTASDCLTALLFLQGATVYRRRKKRSTFPLLLFFASATRAPAPAWGEMLIALVAVAPSHFFNKFIVPLERSPYGIVREAIF